MEILLIALVLIAVFIMFRVPIGVSIGLGTMVYLLFKGLPIEVVPHKMYNTVGDNFTLLAIPLFLLAGNIMNTGGVTKRLFDFAHKLVGHIKGGLGHVCVMASIIFAGMSGSATADAVGLGSIEIPAMAGKGFKKEFAASIVLASSVIGPIIPPSIIMIIYAVVSGTSVGALFVAGIIPGLLMGLSLMLLIFLISLKKNYPSSKWTGFKNLFISGIKAFPVLLTPIIIIGGIYLGLFTATEAAMVAVVYSLILGFIFKELTLKKLWQVIQKCAVDVGILMFIIGITGAFGWSLTTENVPTYFAEAVFSITKNRYAILILVNIIILFLGLFLDATPIVLIMVPILAPLLKTMGIDLVYFGILISVNTMIGLTTPPVGVCLYGVSSIAKVPMEKIVRAYMPFLGVLVLNLLLLILFEDIALLIPRLLGLL